MKALVYAGGQDVRLAEVPEPQAGPGEIVLEVLRAGVCGTDLGAVRNGRPQLGAGVTLGHEFVGRRADTGALAVVNPILSCGDCPACAAGRPQICARRQVLGVHRPGAFAERVAVPVGNVVDVADLDLTQAALVEPVATALHAWRLTPQPAGDVAVLGAGAIGLCTVIVLKAHGVRRITATDISPARLAIAAALGADVTETAPSADYAAVIDSVGSVETRRDACLRVRPGGTAVLVGLHAEELVVPGGAIVAGERSIRGSFAYTPQDFVDAIGLVRGLDTGWVRTTPFSESAAAFADLVAGRGEAAHVKVQFAVAA